MSWTEGQPKRVNQSPFVNSDLYEQGHSSAGYQKFGAQRGNNRQRQYSSSPYISQQDVAATFTQEGLQAFAAVLTSTVEVAIAKSLQAVVEESVEHGLQRFMEQELSSSVEDALTGMLKNAKERIERSIADPASVESN